MSVGVENPPLETGKVVLYGVLAHENSKRSLNIFLKTTYFLSWILDVLSEFFLD